MCHGHVHMGEDVLADLGHAGEVIPPLSWESLGGPGGPGSGFWAFPEAATIHDPEDEAPN